MCLIHFKLWFNRKPRKLKSSTRSISIVLIRNLGYNTVLLTEWKTMILFYSYLRNDLFADRQSLILHNSKFNKCSSAGVPVTQFTVLRWSSKVHQL